MTTEITQHGPAERQGGRILVVDDESASREALSALLETEGYVVRSASNGIDAMGEIDKWQCDVLLTDLRMPAMNGIDLIRQARSVRPQLASIVMTAFGSIEHAVDAMKAGAEDFLLKPVDFETVDLVVKRAFERLRMKRELEALREAAPQNHGIIGNSPLLKEVTDLILQAASSRATILVTGESGTGKELAARMLHEASPRARRPFVAVNGAALAESLLESELFGHERGAFTGASASRRGRFEEADEGTLFLDEVGEISQTTQVKLLRFLQEREFERVGGNKTITVDVRVIAATHRNLEEEVQAGRFRKDLYYRLNVILVKMPPLRELKTDIGLLVQHFVARFAAENRKTIREVSPETMRLLESHDWPGNIRELENVIERAVVLAESDTIDPRHLPSGFAGTVFSVDEDIRIPGSCLESIERFAILKTFEAMGGNTAETARILDVSVRKVQYKLKEYRTTKS